MTKPGDTGGGGPRTPGAADPIAERCRWCGRRLPERSGTGRPRTYCRQGCRQQAHMARKLARTHGLADGDVIVARDAIDDLQGALYCLQAAIEDVDADLTAAGDDPAEVRRALAWLLENARPVAAAWIAPRTADPSA